MPFTRVPLGLTPKAAKDGDFVEQCMERVEKRMDGERFDLITQTKHTQPYSPEVSLVMNVSDFEEIREQAGLDRTSGDYVGHLPVTYSCSVCHSTGALDHLDDPLDQPALGICYWCHNAFHAHCLPPDWEKPERSLWYTPTHALARARAHTAAASLACRLVQAAAAMVCLSDLDRALPMASSNQWTGPCCARKQMHATMVSVAHRAVARGRGLGRVHGPNRQIHAWARAHRSRCTQRCSTR
jgi:hypothetical protein